jgi:hypothetical protein
VHSSYVYIIRINDLNKHLHILCNHLQEDSFQMGLSYMIAAVALYDEYTNDLLYLKEGSCLPRCDWVVISTTIRTADAKKMLFCMPCFISNSLYLSVTYF